MKLTVTGRRVNVSDELRRDILSRVSRLERLLRDNAAPTTGTVWSSRSPDLRHQVSPA